MNPYLVVGYLSLGVIFLAQMGQGLVFANFLVVVIGALGLLTRLRVRLMFFLAALVGAHVVHHAILYRFRTELAPRFLDPADVALCIGVLGYLSAHYRLQSIWQHALTPDPRRRKGPPRRSWIPFVRRPAPIQMQRRTFKDEQAQKEIALLLLTLPLWALLAQLGLAFIAGPRDLLGMHPRLVQYVLLIWILVAGALVTAALLRVWKHAQRKPEAAQLFLQDALWRDTRGEQRRVNRWLAWGKIRRM